MNELSEGDIQRIVGGIPSSNLVLFYPGLQGRGSTLIDRSQSANHGTISGATWTRLPSGLWVLSFDGSNDKVDGPLCSALSLTTQITVSMWLYPTAPTETLVFYAWKNSCYAYTQSSKWGVSQGKAGGGNVSLTDKGTVTGTTWQHFLFSLNGDTGDYLMCLNGVSIGTGSGAAFTLEASDYHVYLGSYNDSDTPSLFWKGRISLPIIESTTRGVTEALRRYTRQRHLFGV